MSAKQKMLEALLAKAGKGSDTLPTDQENAKEAANAAEEADMANSMPNSQMMKEMRAKAMKSKKGK
jgi:hypothetical protein